jgi:UDP-glucose 4-epimerase
MIAGRKTRLLGRGASLTAGETPAHMESHVVTPLAPKRRALVTGGAGFIGSHVVEALLADGCDVCVLDNLSTGSISNVAHLMHRSDFRLVVESVLSAATVTELAAKCDVVYHLAAQIDVRRSVADPGLDAHVNVAGTANVLEAARQASARVVLASTAAIYGDPQAIPIPESAPVAPLSPYGAGKYAAELYLQTFSRLYGLPTIALRMANVYGPRQDPHGEAGVVAIFCGAAAEGRTATIFGDGLQTRDYVYVGDVAAAFAAAGRADVTGALNVSTGLETSLLELAAHLGLATEHGPERAGEIARSCLDPTAAKQALGWAATMPLREGLRHTVTSAAA